MSIKKIFKKRLEGKQNMLLLCNVCPLILIKRHTEPAAHVSFFHSRTYLTGECQVNVVVAFLSFT